MRTWPSPSTRPTTETGLHPRAHLMTMTTIPNARLRWRLLQPPGWYLQRHLSPRPCHRGWWRCRTHWRRSWSGPTSWLKCVGPVDVHSLNCRSFIPSRQRRCHCAKSLHFVPLDQHFSRTICYFIVAKIRNSFFREFICLPLASWILLAALLALCCSVA